MVPWLEGVTVTPASNTPKKVIAEFVPPPGWKLDTGTTLLVRLEVRYGF